MEQLEPRWLLNGGVGPPFEPLAGTASIYGKVAEDLNGNGVLDANDPGLVNWAAQLLDAEGVVLQTTLTQADPAGSFSFNDLPAGNYQVRLIVPSTWVQTTPAFPAYAYSLAEGQEILTADFGTGQYCTLGGRKFNDADGDGVLDDGEAGINGQTIELYDDQGQLVATQVTANSAVDGAYRFTDLLPGSYEIRETPPAGWYQTAPEVAQRSFDLTSGQHVTDLHVGNAQYSSINGHKFHDVDGNGQQDEGELRLGGWTIELYDDQGALVDTTTTNASESLGFYQFSNVMAGSFEVREVLADSSWVQTFPAGGAVHAIDVLPNQVIADRDFGNAQYASVSGYKFHDLDGDGEWDDGEPGLGGWTIELYDPQGQLIDTTTTDDGEDPGYYEFTDITPAPGDFEVREGSRAGWYQTAPVGGVQAGTLASGDVVTDGDFGNTEYATISGYKFHDYDGDGVWDDNEPGVGGWTVELYDDQGELVATTTTDTGEGLGYYEFTDVTPGDYEVREENRADWVQTFPAEGTHSPTIVSGDDWMGDFGNYEAPGSGVIRGIKFEDANGNGEQDEGEDGLPGWTIFLDMFDGGGYYEGSGAQRVTDANGEFAFLGRESGEYEIYEDVQPGWIPTTPTDGMQIIDVNGETPVEVEFGNRRAAVAVDDRFTVIDHVGVNLLDVLANDMYVLNHGVGNVTIVGIDTSGTQGTATISDDDLHIEYTSPAAVGGDDTFTYTLDDAGRQSTATVTVTPVDTSLANQSTHHSQDTLSVPLAQTSVPGDTIVYTATVSGLDPYVRSLQQTHDITRHIPQWNNWHGRQEKWMKDSGGNWCYVLPDGGLYRGVTDVLLGMVGQRYYNNPLLIINGLPGPEPGPFVTANIPNGQLVLDPPAAFVGQVTVYVTATLSGSNSSVVQSQFTLTVWNTVDAPDVQDQNVSHLQDTLDLAPLPQNGNDGDPQTYATQAAWPGQAAWEIKQGLGLASYVPIFDDYRGIGEKWFLTNGGNWYFILINGGVFHPGNSLPVGRTSSHYHMYPQMLIDLTGPVVPQATVTTIGTQVTVDPLPGFVGPLQVELRAQDGAGWAARTFWVNVTNNLPDLSFLTDQTMAPGQTDLVIPLPQTDADGQGITYQAWLRTDQGDAWNLKNTYGFVGHWSPWDNHFGQGAKWLWDNTGTWYYITPMRYVYRDGSGQALGRVAQDYYDNPVDLVDVAPFQQVIGTTSLNGSLTVTPDPGFSGTFHTDLQGDDGVELTDIATFQTVFTGP